MTELCSRILSLDLGGSHLAGVIMSGNHRISRKSAVSVPIPSICSWDDFLAIVHHVGTLAVEKAGVPMKSIQAVAMAAPSPFDYSDGVSLMQHKHTQLYGMNLRNGLAKLFELETKRIVFLHDAQAFLLGEIDQSALDDKRVIGITLGTGIGSAFARNGRILTQADSVPPAGEL